MKELTIKDGIVRIIEGETEYVFGIRDRTCVQCLYFDKRDETCSKYKQRPPAQVIAYGCETFEQDIPF